MSPQTLDFSSRVDGGADTAPPGLYIEPTILEPQIDGGGSSSGEQAEGFEGISTDEVKIMMELMSGPAGTTEKDTNIPPVQPFRLQLCTLMAQADVAEWCFSQLGAVEYIVKEVECRRRIVSLLPIWHVAKPYHLDTFGTSLFRKFKCLGDLADINQAIECLCQVMLLTPDDHPEKHIRFNNLGNSYETRFERLGEFSDLENAIECHITALQRTPDGHPEKPASLNRLGSSYMTRFECLGEFSDLDHAIECHIQAAQCTPDGHSDKPGRVGGLGTSYLRRFEHLGKLSDLNNAIECHSQAVQLTPDDHPSKLNWFNNLGNSCLSRFLYLGELSDMGDAIGYHTQAVQLTPDGHPDKPCPLSNLGNSYQARFKRFGELSDLDNAIECQTQAVQLTHDGQPDKPGRLANLGGSFYARFERLGQLSDLDNAIENHTQAVHLTPDGYLSKSGWLNNLGTSYQARFKRLGDISDLDDAIECQSQAVKLTPDDHPEQSRCLSNLGNSYIHRFNRFGKLSDLDNAIMCHTQAVQLTPDGHPDKPSQLNNLGISYMSRSDRLGELLDLDHATECHTQAVQLIPDGHPDKPSWQSNLGNSYLRRFEHLGELSDIENAIECHSQAVQLIPDGHPNQSAWLNNLGNSYRTRFRHLAEISDLNNAIKCHTQATQLTPDGHPDKPSWLSNLGSSLHARFERIGELADLDNATQCHTQAVKLTPDGHPDKPLRLGGLGDAYLSRFKSSGEHAALQLAQSTYQNGAQLASVSPKSQLRCARKWAKTSSLLGISPQEAYERCMELVPHLIWLGATINHRYTLLVDVHDLATQAASWAISVQSYDLAIEWLEEGRSIVWNQILQLRTPIDDLSAADPVLALHLKNVASQLEASGTRQETTSSLNDQSSGLEKSAQHHRQLAAEWEKCLNQVRSIPGYESFMGRRKASELKRAANNGPVVLINAHSTRWDALVIFPECDNTAHIPLDKLPQNESRRLFSELDFRSVSGHRGEWHRTFKRVNNGTKLEDPLRTELAALWLRVVKPILDALGYTRKLPINELPHVTWCATGPLALAPLHAAGLYDDLSLNAFDLAISSYTPSLSALLASSAPVAQSSIRVLAVGQENTPGQLPLPSTVDELAAIKQYASSSRYLQLDSKNATVEGVLTAMGEHNWVHLACHATQNSVNPAYSAFHLHDGDLTLEAITKRQFKNKGLAFLSACQTAKGDGELPDEAIHLAAGMLMAGYPSVIATMWSIADKDGPEVAGRVYAELLRDERMDYRGAARALHQAVAELREKIGMDSFMRWVPFIHIGV